MSAPLQQSRWWLKPASMHAPDGIGLDVLLEVVEVQVDHTIFTIIVEAIRDRDQQQQHQRCCTH